MRNTYPVSVILRVALMAAVVAALGFASVQVSAQTSASAGPTSQDCFSVRFPAASGCDLVNMGQSSIPGTGSGSVAPASGADVYGPTRLDCFSTRFHAASDCDRLSGSRVGTQR
jgi:hypothetical protein